MNVSIYRKVLLKLVSIYDLYKLHNNYRKWMFSSTILATPKYISQISDADKKLIIAPRGIIDDSRAAKRFGTDLPTFSYWAWRSCGVVCIQMLLATKGIKITTMELVKEGLKMKGYDTQNDVGWYHGALVSIAGNHQLDAKSKRYLTFPGIIFALSSNKYVIASIHSSHGGHMILVYGVKISNNKQVSGIYFNDPYNINRPGDKQYMSLKRFTQKFKHMGVVVSVN